MANATAQRQPSPDSAATCAAAPIAQRPADHQRLSTFAFLMSAHRMPVCASMMAGDTHYLRQQLRLACTTDDGPLQQLAAAMLRELAGDRSVRCATNLWSH